MSFANRIDIRRSRYPYCIVWTPLPLITWFFPIVGHVGISNSDGVIRDFAGSFYVSEDDMAFGEPTRYWPLYPQSISLPADAAEVEEMLPAMSAPQNGEEPLERDATKTADSVYNEAVSNASEEYSKKVHSLWFDNCHSHVARCLNLMGYEGRRNWTMYEIAWRIWKDGYWVNVPRALKTILPFILFLCVIIVLIAFL
eukprot:Sdes_comp23609_c0_seq1m21807